MPAGATGIEIPHDSTSASDTGGGPLATFRWDYADLTTGNLFVIGLTSDPPFNLVMDGQNTVRTTVPLPAGITPGDTTPFHLRLVRVSVTSMLGQPTIYTPRFVIP